MKSPDGDVSPGVEGGKTPLQDAIERYVAGIEAGNTRATYAAQLERWSSWLSTYRGVDELEDLDVLDCRRYATTLKERVRDDEIEASTARTYYATVRAFLSWCVDEELLEGNPAAASRATDELPEDVGDTDQQFWPPEQREQLIAYVQERAHDALDESAVDRAQAFRDRALAAMLALSGVRGAEVAREPRDDRRDGLRWEDVDLEQRTAEVLGKNRRLQDVPLPERVVSVLEQHKRAQDPPSERWPVFPTGHRPTLRAALEDELGDDVVDELLQEATLDEVLEDQEIAPPAITVDGARAVMRRLSEAAGLDVDGEYLKPHGGRRGIGDQLYRSDPALAQLALRHGSLETTHESYQDIQAGEVAAKIDDVLDES